MVETEELDEELEEEEEDDAEGLTEVYPYAARLESGTIMVLDATELAEQLGAVAFWLTTDDNFYYLKNGEWLYIPVSNKKPSKLKPVN